MKKYIGLLLLFSLIGVIYSQIPTSMLTNEQKHYVSFENTKSLEQYFRWDEQRKPLIGAHRGGPLPGYPENCIETFDNTLRYAPCIIECDVNKTKDGVLIMMHDNTLNRTTNGKGSVKNFTWKELQKLQLKDNEGNLTPYKIPSLAQVLNWAKGKAVLELDIKKEISPQEIVTIVEKYNAKSYTVVITYSLEATKQYHKLCPDLMISASSSCIPSSKRLLRSKIKHEKLMVFVGVSEPKKELYRQFHRAKIMCILGTLGNLDRKAKRKGIGVYIRFLENGANILATDNVPLAAKAIEKFWQAKKL